MAERVYQNANGVRRSFITDADRPGQLVVRTEQVLDEIMAGIARDRELMSHDGVNKLVARIPVAIFERAALEQWDEAKWRRWLNSSEAAPFRIWQGKV